MLAVLLGAAALLATAVDNEAGPSGLALSAAVVAGVVGGDAVAGAVVGGGVSTEPFSLHLQLPLLLRVQDNPPAVDPALPSFCGLVRCEELLAGEELDPTALARVVQELRLFQPGDVFHLRAGALTATLGAGAVVDRLTTAASWDRRTSGVFSALRLPWHSLQADVVVADLVSPGELVAARLELAPVSALGLRLGVEGGVDVGAPVDLVDRTGALGADGQTRALLSTVFTAGWVLLRGTVDLQPRLELQGSSGLAADGGTEGALGAGVGAGVDVGVDFDVVDARLKLSGSLGSDAHRRGVFSTLYLVERRQALLGASVEGGGLLRVPAPAGAAVDARIEASILDAAVTVLRLHLEPAPGANALEAGVIVDAAPWSFSLFLLRRGFDGANAFGADLQRQPLIGALQASWRFFGPLSVALRWVRLPRFGERGLSVENDFLVLLSANTVLVPSSSAD